MEGTLNIRKSDTEMSVREISNYRIHDDRQLQSSEPGQPVHTGVCRRFVMPGDSVKKECKY